MKIKNLTSLLFIFLFSSLSSMGCFTADNKTASSDESFITEETNDFLRSMSSDRIVDLEVGALITLKAVNGLYVSADNTDNTLIANKTEASDYEKFEVVDAGNNLYGLKNLGNDKYVCAEKQGTEALCANRDRVGSWESFIFIITDDTIGLISNINTKYVCAENNGSGALIANRERMGSWEEFSLHVTGNINGDINEKPTVTFIKPTPNVSSPDLGVVVEASDSDGEIAEVKLYINETFVRREGGAPYEWGTANSNQEDPALLNLAPGTYTLRAVAVDNKGAERSTTRNVTVKTASTDMDDVEFKNFTKLSREEGSTTGFTSVDSQYVIYVESWGREGHNNISMTQNTNKCPTIDGATLENVGGGQDKFIALYKINNSAITIHNTGGSAQILFIKTGNNVTLIAKSVDPAVGAETIKGPQNENQITVYAEDEGGKGDRDEFFMPEAMKWYGNGDDLLYLFGYGDLAPDNDEGPNGNGAVGTLTFL